MSATDLVLLAHSAATLMMCGLIWFVQVVHYPLFGSVGPADFAAYERDHMRRTGWVVGPLMVAEAATGLALLGTPVATQAPGLVWGALVLLAAVWLVTGFVSAPIHGRLAAGRDGALIRRLVASNWIRTVLWSARGLIALWLLGTALGRPPAV